MRIGIVTDNYFPSVGGTEVSIKSYKKQLEKLGHKVYIFCPSLGSKTPKREHKQIVRLPSLRGIYSDHPLMYITPRLLKRFAEYDLDIIHSQTPISAPIIAEYVAKRLKLPHVHTVHTLVPEQVRRSSMGILRPLLLYLVQSIWLKNFRFPATFVRRSEGANMDLRVRLSWVFMLRLAHVPDMVIFPTEYVRNLFRHRGFRNTSAVLPTFTDMFRQKVRPATARTVAARKQPPTIIYVGRLDKEKRPEVLVKAARYLARDMPWRVVMVGNGAMKSRLKFMVRSHGLRDRFEFTGSLSPSMIARLLKKSDIFVMTSYRFDTQGIVLLEAAAAGLPIVYCDEKLTVGTDGGNSLLTGREPKEVAAGIQRLIEDRELRETMAHKSIEINKAYAPEALTAQLVEIYQQAIG